MAQVVKCFSLANRKPWVQSIVQKEKRKKGKKRRHNLLAL
jgi:hypothetical protein